MNEILYQMKESSNNTSFDSDNSDNSFSELGNNVFNEEKEEIQIKKKEFNLIYNNIISNQPKKENFTFKREEEDNKYTKLKFPNARYKIYKELFFTKGRTIKELIFRTGLNFSNQTIEKNEQNNLMDIKNYFLKSKEKFYYNLKQKSKSFLIKSKSQSLEQNKVNILNLKKSSSLACFDNKFEINNNRIEIKENRYSFLKNDDKESKIKNDKMLSRVKKKKDIEKNEKINKEIQTIFINEIEKYLYNRTTTIQKMKLDKINKIGDLYMMESYYNNINLEDILLHDIEFQNKRINFREFLADLTIK